MANTPTLDEIEAGLDVVEPYLTHDYQRSLLALVAHVRELDERMAAKPGALDKTNMRIGVVELGQKQEFDEVTARITALEEKNALPVSLPSVVMRRVAAVHGHGERIAALEAKVAALSAADDVGRAAARAESATSPRMAQKAWAPVAEELDRLRAENAELRKRIAELEEWWRCNLCFGSGFYVANSGAGKVECPYCGPSVSREKPTAAKPWPAPAWPPPQPIETAPLAEILTYPLGNPERKGWAREWPGTGETVDEWRAMLKKWGRTHWLPMPPPPGGGK